jgi:hypothetical protein
MISSPSENDATAKNAKLAKEDAKRRKESGVGARV